MIGLGSEKKPIAHSRIGVRGKIWQYAAHRAVVMKLSGSGPKVVTRSPSSGHKVILM